MNVLFFFFRYAILSVYSQVENLDMSNKFMQLFGYPFLFLSFFFFWHERPFYSQPALKCHWVISKTKPLFPKNYFPSKCMKLRYLLGPLNLFLGESSATNSRQTLHFFNLSRHWLQLEGSSESISTHFWSRAGSLLNIAEHGKPLLCKEKSNLPWNWKVGAKQPRPKWELYSEYCSFKTQ